MSIQEIAPISDNVLEEKQETDEDLIKAWLYSAQPTFERLASTLEHDINLKEWDIVIGDDASGRLPALFVGELVNAWREDNGLPPAQRIFIGGGRVLNENYRDIREEDLGALRPEDVKPAQETIAKRAHVSALTEERISSSAARALIVTDCIETGSTVYRIGSALQKLGVPFDIAAFEIFDTPENTLDRVRCGNLDGAEHDDIDLYAGRQIYHGATPVFKPHESEYGTPLRSTYGVVRVEGGSANVEAVAKLQEAQHGIQVARAVIKSLADTCYRNYFIESSEEAGGQL